MDTLLGFYELPQLRLYSSAADFWMDARFYLGWMLGLFLVPCPTTRGRRRRFDTTQPRRRMAHRQRMQTAWTAAITITPADFRDAMATGASRSWPGAEVRNPLVFAVLRHFSPPPEMTG